MIRVAGMIFSTLALLLFLHSPQTFGDDALALQLSQEIFEKHAPWGVLISPNTVSPDSDEILGYLHSGDSAIWTGHWLAAEVYRYATLKDQKSLSNVRSVLQAIENLVSVTGTDLLARSYYPEGVKDIELAIPSEQRHGFWPGEVGGKKYVWLGNTTRDQYAGVFFGLGAAYDFVDQPDVKERSKNLIIRMTRKLLKDKWIIRDPTGDHEHHFWGRPEQRLSILQLAAHVDSKGFKNRYKVQRALVGHLVGAVIIGETTAPYTSYYKFNLAHAYLYNLVRLEKSKYWKWVYTKWFKAYRKRLADHDNAHFNMIERALLGPDPIRESKTHSFLEEWKLRPRRHTSIDNTGKYPECKPNISCVTIRVADRITTDFLWQRSPHQLKKDDDATLLSPGVDYILPYWMLRFYQTELAK